MVKETQLDSITGMIDSIIAGSPDIFLVEVKIKPTNNVKVFLDGDSGISIQRCAEVNRSLYKRLEESESLSGWRFLLGGFLPGAG